MTRFIYICMRLSGEFVAAEMEAPDRVELIQMLWRDQLFLVWWHDRSHPAPPGINLDELSTMPITRDLIERLWTIKRTSGPEGQLVESAPLDWALPIVNMGPIESAQSVIVHKPRRIARPLKDRALLGFAGLAAALCTFYGVSTFLEAKQKDPVVKKVEALRKNFLVAGTERAKVESELTTRAPGVQVSTMTVYLDAPGLLYDVPYDSEGGPWSRKNRINGTVLIHWAAPQRRAR